MDLHISLFGALCNKPYYKYNNRLVMSFIIYYCLFLEVQNYCFTNWPENIYLGITLEYDVTPIAAVTPIRPRPLVEGQAKKRQAPIPTLSSDHTNPLEVNKLPGLSKTTAAPTLCVLGAKISIFLMG